MPHSGASLLLCNDLDGTLIPDGRAPESPFRQESGDVIPNWISRFEIWPDLERFSFDAERDVLAELGGRPDLIIGNYSDGNLVATLRSQRLGVTECAIAHALEKSKYMLSDLYWHGQDDHYHFSCQFTADLIAMNNRPRAAAMARS
jgi:sucrose synthase